MSIFPVNPPRLRPRGLALSLDGSGSPPHSPPMLAIATFVEANESISPRPSQLPWAQGVGCPTLAGLARRVVTCHLSCLRQRAEALGKVVGGQGQQQMA